MKVLYLEQQDGLRRMMIKELAREGITIVAAETTDEALEAIRTDNEIRGALIYDTAGPGDGRCIARALSEIRPEIFIAIITSGRSETLTPEDKVAKVKRILTTPFSIRELVSYIRDAGAVV